MGGGDEGVQACLTSVAAGSPEEEEIGCQKEGGSGPKARATRGEDKRRRHKRRTGEVEGRGAVVAVGLLIMTILYVA